MNEYPDIYVNICENNKRGTRSGKVQQFWFEHPDGDMFLHLECRHFEGARIMTHDTFNPLQLAMYGCLFKYESSQDWAGNIYWNRYRLYADHALGLINLIMRKRDFVISEALTSICEKWEKGIELVASDIGIDQEITPTIINPAQQSLFNNKQHEK